MPTKYDHTELKKIREFLGWSVSDLVEKSKSLGLNFSERTVYNWEQNETTPDADTLATLAGLFGVSIERFYK